MADIISFTPQRHLDARENMDGFIVVCRDHLTVFGKDLPFAEHVWDVSDWIKLKARTNTVRIVFSNWSTATHKENDMMAQPFISFAKAYIRYQHGMRPTKSIGGRVAALRALEHALSENGLEPNPVRIDAGILNRSAQLIQQKFTGAVSYRTGSQLELIAEFMRLNHLVEFPIQWRNPIPRSLEGARVGKEFDARRERMLPSKGTLEAIPKAFRSATEPDDVIICSTVALLCTAPDRINEVLLLPENCEVNQKRPDNGEQAYGLRWWPAKGADPTIKWIIGSMSSVAKAAITNIRKHTEEARSVAKWYEMHPTKIFLPPQLEHLRTKDVISNEELVEILFTTKVSKASCRGWCQRNKVKTIRPPKGDELFYVRFTDVESAVLKLLRANMLEFDREVGLSFSKALFVTLRNALHNEKATYRCVVAKVTQDNIYNRLGNKKDMVSVFDHLNLYEENGNSIVLKSHQLRHYLNMLARAGGMTELDIALWSGRKDVSQNAAYDHTSARDMVAHIREKIGDGKDIFGPLATITKAIPVSRVEFARLRIPTAHTTEIGFCVHDYTMSPCSHHRDCMNCDDLICIKGDEVRNSAIKKQREETQELIEKSKVAMNEEEYGADRWVEHHTVTLNRLNQICDILDDPVIPPGSVIQLSRLHRQPSIEQSNYAILSDVSNNRKSSSYSRLGSPRTATQEQIRVAE